MSKLRISSLLLLGFLLACSSASEPNSGDGLALMPRSNDECAYSDCGDWPDDPQCDQWQMGSYGDHGDHHGCQLDCPRGGPTAPIAVHFECNEVHIVSCKDISNVVLAFEDGERFKFDGLVGHYATFGGGERKIVAVWVKAGNNGSGDGPGYGQPFYSDAHCDDPSGGTGGHGGTPGTGGNGGTPGTGGHAGTPGTGGNGGTPGTGGHAGTPGTGGNGGTPGTGGHAGTPGTGGNGGTPGCDCDHDDCEDDGRDCKDECDHEYQGCKYECEHEARECRYECDQDQHDDGRYCKDECDHEEHYCKDGCEHEARYCKDDCEHGDRGCEDRCDADDQHYGGHYCNCAPQLACPRGGSEGHIEVDFECSAVHISSCKDISNVVLEFADGQHRKFDNLKGQCATLGAGDKQIVGVWVKAGDNGSGDGPGYGQRFDSDAYCPD